MFDQRFEIFKKVRDSLKKLIQEYHESVKMSFHAQNESDQNTIGYFLNDCIKKCELDVSTAMYDTPLRLDFIHKNVIKKHFKKITEYIESKLNVLPKEEIDNYSIKYFADELMKIRLWF